MAQVALTLNVSVDREQWSAVHGVDRQDVRDDLWTYLRAALADAPVPINLDSPRMAS